MENNYIVIYITTKNREDAKRLGNGLVEKRLAACAAIIGEIESIYRWKGKKYDEAETLLLLKSKKVLFDRIEEYVIKNHSYDVPEIVAVPIVAGFDSYLEWIDENTVK